MDVRQMKYFVTIVDSASFSQASRLLNIAQPALSQQISRLEYDIGAPLLLRSSRGVSPTSAGVILYRHAKSILRQIDYAMTSTRDSNEIIQGRVTLGLPPTTICQLGVQIVERVRRNFPGILLNLVEGLSGHLQRQAIAGDLDLAVIFAQEAIPGWDAVALLREELFLVCPKDERFFPLTTTSVSLRDVAKLPLILPSGKHGLRRRIDLEYERLDIKIAPAAEIDSLPILMHCLAQGMGVTIKPSAAINVHGAELASCWRCLTISDVSLTRVNYLYSPPDEELLPVTETVRAELIRLARDMATGGNWLGVSFIGSNADKKQTASVHP